MTHHLVITAVGTDRPGISNQITKLITQSGCNIIDSRITLFGDEFSIILLISGPVSAITRVETLMPQMSQTHDLLSIMKRTSPHKTLNYTHKVEMSVLSCDGLGITEKFTQLCEAFSINIAELSANTSSYTSQDADIHALMPQLKLGDLLFNLTISGAIVSEETLFIQNEFDKICKDLGAKGQINFIKTGLS